MLSLIWIDPFVTESSKIVTPTLTSLNSLTLIGIVLAAGLFYWWIID